MNPQSLDPLQIRRYTVFRVYYGYAGQEPGEKLFVALKHIANNGTPYCWAIKATSKVERFAALPDATKGYVEYAAGALAFFPQATIIDPSNFLPTCHSTLASEAKNHRYCIEGQMPSDFHARIIAAIRESKTLEPKKKVTLLASVGETLLPTGILSSKAKV